MHHGCTHEQFEPGYDPRVTDEQAIAALVQLVQSGLTVDQAETRVGRPDGWARPALRGWAEAQGWGYAATADHLGLPRNTVKSWWQRARARQVLAGVVPASAPPRVVDFTPSPTPSSPSRGEKKPPPDLEVDAASMSREDFLFCADLYFDAGRAEDALSVLREFQTRYPYEIGIGLRESLLSERLGRVEESVLAALKELPCGIDLLYPASNLEAAIQGLVK